MCIAAYQAARFLPAALGCVGRQILGDWELIVVEDGSDDGTRQLVEAFAADHPSHRVIYERFGSNRGVAAARSRSMELAEGEMVAFLDADDLWEPDHLASLAACLADGHALACTPIRIWDGDLGVDLGVHAPTPAQIAEPRSELIRESFIMTSTCVALPRRTIEKTGSFDSTLQIGEDRDYWFRSLEGGGTLGVSARATCRYTKHQGSSMTRTLRVAEDVVRFHTKHRDADDVPAALSRAKLAEALLVHGRLLRKHRPATAHSCFREALQLEPWRPLAWAGFCATLAAR